MENPDTKNDIARAQHIFLFDSVHTAVKSRENYVRQRTENVSGTRDN